MRSFAGVGCVCGSKYEPGKKASDSAHKIVHSADLKWTLIIKGCEIALVEGNLDAEGQPFVARFHCSDGAQTPPHWHPTDENITVLRGAFLVGMGESFDESRLRAMNAGNFMLMPKEMRHFGMSKGDLILQVHGIGPFKVNWVNPSEVQPPDAPAAARDLLHARLQDLRTLQGVPPQEEPARVAK